MEFPCTRCTDKYKWGQNSCIQYCSKLPEWQRLDAIEKDDKLDNEVDAMAELNYPLTFGYVLVQVSEHIERIQKWSSFDWRSLYAKFAIGMYKTPWRTI